MSTSRKRNKASKGKKNSTSPGHSTSSRASLTSKSSGEGDQMMPDLKESGTSAEGAGAGAETLQGKAKASKPGSRGQEKGGKSKAPAARMVYFDPSIVLPPADKRTGKCASLEICFESPSVDDIILQSTIQPDACHIVGSMAIHCTVGVGEGKAERERGREMRRNSLAFSRCTTGSTTRR